MEDVIIIEKKKATTQAISNKRGVLILALGHPYYGCYAFNLALSIKASCPHMPVAIAYNDTGIQHLDPPRKALIDLFLKVDQSYFTEDIIRAKLYLDKISPFEETLALDADIIWFPQRPVDALMNSLASSEVAISNKGYMPLKDAHDKFIQWTKGSEILKAYPEFADRKLYNLFSEMIWFKKGETTTRLFDEARRIAQDPKVSYMQFAGGMPDELAFELAMMSLDMELQKQPLTPFYWEVFEKKNLAANIMYQQFYAYSMGGAFLMDSVIKFYDNLAKYYTNKFSLPYHFPARQKRTFLPERANI